MPPPHEYRQPKPTVTTRAGGSAVGSIVDFTVAGRTAGSRLVAGALAGTLVGASITVGTAQLAFVQGWSAVWFTVGAAVGCLLLGSVLASAIRASGAETISQVLGRAYGPGARLVASLVNSLSMLLTIVSQLLAGAGLVSAVSGMSPGAAAMVSAGLMAAYVLGGGLRAIGAMGMLKVGLLYLGLIVAATSGYQTVGGDIIRESSPPSFLQSLFSRGIVMDLDAALSITVGVISTQVYFQALTAGQSLQAARRGAYVAAVLVAPIGIASVVIGLVMRVLMPELPPLLAFPAFLTDVVNPWIGAALTVVLLLNVIGTGAGMALGISTTLVRDLGALRRAPLSDGAALWISRGLIVATLGVAVVIVSSHTRRFILHWAFLAFGVRGAAICLPLAATLLFGTSLGAATGLATMVAVVVSMGAATWWLPGQPHATYLGLAASGAVLLMGALARRAAARARRPPGLRWPGWLRRVRAETWQEMK